MKYVKQIRCSRCSTYSKV